MGSIKKKARFGKRKMEKDYRDSMKNFFFLLLKLLFPSSLLLVDGFKLRKSEAWPKKNQKKKFQTKFS